MTGDRHRACRPGALSGRNLIAAAAVAAVCLLASACGGALGSPVASIATTTAAQAATTGASTTAGTPATQESALLAFSACMPSHGVAAFPDPTRNADGSYGFATDLGKVRKLIRSAQTALGTCQPLLAKSGILSAANIAKFQQQMLAYATCMGSHGVHDPNANGRFKDN